MSSKFGRVTLGAALTLLDEAAWLTRSPARYVPPVVIEDVTALATRGPQHDGEVRMGKARGGATRSSAALDPEAIARQLRYCWGISSRVGAKTSSVVTRRALSQVVRTLHNSMIGS